MKIKIQQVKTSAKEYTVKVDQQETHVVLTSKFKLRKEICILTLGGQNIQYTLNKKFSLFSTAFDLSINNQTYQFRTKSIWLRHYYCEIDNNLYEVFGHKGHKYSIFKNGIQIAFWDREFTRGEIGKTLLITADKNCTSQLLICFCLALEHRPSQENHNGYIIDFNIGNIGPEAKKFDTDWQAKQ